VGDYEFEVEKVKREVVERGAKKILLQFPDGLKKYSLWIADELSGVADVFISGSHTWGPCDVDVVGARAVGADLIVHFGHNPLTLHATVCGVNVLFVPAFSNIRLEEGLKRALKLLNGLNRVGLVASVQHVPLLSEIKEELTKRGLKAFIGKPDELGMFKGQVLGCNYSAALSVRDKVDGYLCIAGGLFHAIGLALISKKRVISLDPYSGKASEVHENCQRLVRKRLYSLMRAMEARRFAIVLSTKVGQLNLVEASKIKKELERRGLSAKIVVVDEVRISELLNFVWPQVFIITACPRIALDYMDECPIPLINKGEVKYILKGNLEDYDPSAALL